MKTKHTPGPWTSGTAGPNMTNNYSQPFSIAQAGKANLIAGAFGDVQGGEEVAAANARLIAAAPELLAALEGLLAQLDGPVMVHGDGRGRDGTKTGLSGEEFNQLRKSRIEAARAAIKNATNP